MKYWILRGIQMAVTIILFWVGSSSTEEIGGILLCVIGGMSVGNLAARAARADKEGL